jgi:hypothetical protein
MAQGLGQRWPNTSLPVLMAVSLQVCWPIVGFNVAVGCCDGFRSFAILVDSGHFG